MSTFALTDRHIRAGVSNHFFIQLISLCMIRKIKCTSHFIQWENNPLYDYSIKTQVTFGSNFIPEYSVVAYIEEKCY